jgi:hypothetical protein
MRDVGDATRCGPKARGVPLKASLNNKSLISFSDYRFQNFTIHVFTCSKLFSISKSVPTFIFQIESLYDLRFTFSRFTIHHIPHKNIHPLKKSPLTQERNTSILSTLSWEIHSPGRRHKARSACFARSARGILLGRLFEQEGLISF